MPIRIIARVIFLVQDGALNGTITSHQLGRVAFNPVCWIKWDKQIMPYDSSTPCALPRALRPFSNMWQNAINPLTNAIKWSKIYIIVPFHIFAAGSSLPQSEAFTIYHNYAEVCFLWLGTRLYENILGNSCQSHIWKHQSQYKILISIYALNLGYKPSARFAQSPFLRC